MNIFATSLNLRTNKLLLYSFLYRENIKNYKIFDKKFKHIVNFYTFLNFFIFSYFFTKIFFSIIFFNTSFLHNFSYNKINFGKYITSQTLRNINTNKSLIFFYFVYTINFLKSVLMYSYCQYIKKDVDLIFVPTSFYLEGIYIDFFVLNSNLPVFIKANPHQPYLIKTKRLGLEYFWEPNSLLTEKIKINKKSIDSYMRKRLISPHKMLYYFRRNEKNFKFSPNKSNNKSLVNYIVYIHSFTDDQMRHGYDGFKSSYDWLMFTIKYIPPDSNVYLKPHPNFFFNKSMSNIEKMDSELWAYCLAKIKLKFPHINIVQNTINNSELLDFFNPKNSILISHHGNAIVEGAYLNFRSISSISSPWGDKFNFSYVWRNLNEYKKVLNNPRMIIRSKINKKKLTLFICTTYLSNVSDYGLNGFFSLVAKYSNISLNELFFNANNKSIDVKNTVLIKRLSKIIKEV